uniref:Putative secreted wc salivary protein n=1 Tax=Ixodes ricinus TaxID=34613 RepID=A0A147BVL1_IXORI
MFRFSQMQLVVIAVVLILPALQSGVFLSGAVVHYDCEDILVESGEIECRLQGSGGFKDYDPEFCTYTCEGPAKPKLPDGVCSKDGVNCTSIPREGLRNRQQKLQSILNGILKEWCPCYPKE